MDISVALSIKNIFIYTSVTSKPCSTAVFMNVVPTSEAAPEWISHYQARPGTHRGLSCATHRKFLFVALKVVSRWANYYAEAIYSGVLTVLVPPDEYTVENGPTRNGPVMATVKTAVSIHLFWTMHGGGEEYPYPVRHGRGCVRLPSLQCERRRRWRKVILTVAGAV